MNRYTFKAKRKDNGEWVYGYYMYSQYDDKDYIFTGNNGYGLNDCREFEYYEIIPETLCQCTGLQDRDGKDIFENDIVSFMEDGDISVGITPLNIKGIIEYLEGSYVVSQENTNNKYIDLMSYTINPSFKIIENKFDKEED